MRMTRIISRVTKLGNETPVGPGYEAIPDPGLNDVERLDTATGQALSTERKISLNLFMTVDSMAPWKRLARPSRVWSTVYVLIYVPP